VRLESLTVVRCRCPVQVADAPHGRGELPDRDDAVQRAGQHGGLMRATVVGLLETKARLAQVRAALKPSGPTENEPGTIRCQPSASRTATTRAAATSV
jgi:hypothetical protein